MYDQRDRLTTTEDPVRTNPADTAEVINANYIMFELPSDIANICALNDYVRRSHNEIKHNLSPAMAMCLL